jgi:glutamyl/glutaminyl-tRNA synthetase
VVDDATMRITHVIRGEDHLTNTARHQALYEALGYAMPAFAHLPMILGPDRSKLSKRHGAVSVMDYREQGYLPEAVVNVLALLGWSSADGQERFTREELVERFDLDRCGRSASIFDFDKTKHFNGLLIRELPVERLQELLEPYFVQLPAMGMERKRALVELLQKDLNLLTDFPEAARPLVEEPTYGEDCLMSGDGGCEGGGRCGGGGDRKAGGTADGGGREGGAEGSGEADGVEGEGAVFSDCGRR